jgi:methanogenic corrinoid protein MtbC1
MPWGTPEGHALWRVREALNRAVIGGLGASHPEIRRLYGQPGLEPYEEGVRLHVNALADALWLDRASVFAEHVSWCGVMLGVRGVPLEDFADQLDALEAAVDRLVPEASEAAGSVIAAGRERLAALQPPPPAIDPASPRAPLANEVLEALSRLDHGRAERRLEKALREGATASALVEEVVAPVLREVGRCWMLGRFTVAQEHYATAALRDVLARLSPSLKGARRGAVAVLASVEGDAHDLGPRIIADLLECRGWETIYLGASTPAAALVPLVAEKKPDAVMLGVSMTRHLRAAAELIQRFRAHSWLRGLRVVVGGAAFDADPSLYAVVGADAHARSADEAHTRALSSGQPLRSSDTPAPI